MERPILGRAGVTLFATFATFVYNAKAYLPHLLGYCRTLDVGQVCLWDEYIFPFVRSKSI